MFAIVGMNFMRGRLGYCEGVKHPYGISKDDVEIKMKIKSPYQLTFIK
jgi:hypothetical protein